MIPTHWPQPEGDSWPQPELDNWPQPEGDYWPLPEGDNWPQLEGNDGLEPGGSFPLNRQPLMYSWPIRSRSIDQVLGTMMTADQVTQSMASVCGSAQGGDPSENFNLQRQGSLSFPSSLSPRTEDEAWKDLIKESGGDKDGSGISGSHLHQRTQTFGEMALEDSCNENEKPNPVGIGGVGTGEGEMEGGLSNSESSGKMKRKEKTPGGGKRGNRKTTGVRNAINLEDTVEHAARHPKVTHGYTSSRNGNLNFVVSKPKLKTASRDYGIQRWPPRQKQELIRQSYPNETSVIVDEEGISQLNYDTLPSDQPLVPTIDTNSGVVIKIHPPQFLPNARQENPDEDFGNYEVEVVGMGEEGTREGEMKEDEDFGNYEVEAVGMGVEGTGEGEMEEGQLNSGCLGKGKSNVETPRGDRGNKKTNGVKIAISFEDILQAERMYLEETGKQMILDNAAKKFKVSRSTLKRVCRKYGILSWPPSKGNENISQSRPKESPAVVDHQEEVQQLNCDILPSDQAWTANVDSNSVVLKARWVDDIIVKIRLPKPWKMTELEQQVKKRLKLESGTYYIRYKDEENELITILCDEDLQEYISSSRPLDTSSIEVYLVPK